jgi:hypothetical protein
MARCGRLTLLGRAGGLGILLYVLGLALIPSVRATMKYGPIELSGSVDSQSLFRSTEIDQWQWIQNRNTALIRLDYDWFQNGKLVDRLEVPFIKRSKLYVTTTTWSAGRSPATRSAIRAGTTRSRVPMVRLAHARSAGCTRAPTARRATG